MRVRLTAEGGKTPAQGVKSILDKVLSQLDASGDLMSRELQEKTREHLRERFPGSEHWNPAKVSMQAGSKTGSGAEGSADVDIPGASRAYHDVVI